ncbi:MAG: tRNA-dihydrouridine synthase family protein [Muribaculaceae bacterium]|nr:tRNA-dihydrouridine synthase family protein [Muribaculaceae bacterium]
MEPKFFAAPMQGLTEAVWRRLHRSTSWRADAYCAPFMRIEHGAPRRKELRDLAADSEALPQVIFRDVEEFSMLLDAVEAAGHSAVDLNLGCPFPPQVKKGRGAGALLNAAMLAGVADVMASRPDMTFSVKMRPGVAYAGDWRPLLPVINRMSLTHVAIHPRLIADPYDGPLLLDEFARMAAEIDHPVVYNGSIAAPADIDRLLQLVPGLHGIMIGRGLLARPTLIGEWRAGSEMTEAERGRALRRLNAEIFNELSQSLCGETQILQKMKPYWLYAPEEIIGRKCLKAIKKSTTIKAYEAALKL